MLPYLNEPVAGDSHQKKGDDRAENGLNYEHVRYFALPLTRNSIVCANSPTDLNVDPLAYPTLGRLPYNTTLPLQDKEIVLTFDDGPRPPFCKEVLKALAKNGAKATFFLIGSVALEFPTLVRRIYDEGHCIGTHTQNHPLPFGRLPETSARKEIEDGMATISGVLNGRIAAPFFRFPGLERSHKLEAHLQSRAISIWSADMVADDWKPIRPSDVVDRALTRLARIRKGIVLLHETQRTALALPILLDELTRRAYRIVHTVPHSG